MYPRNEKLRLLVIDAPLPDVKSRCPLPPPPPPPPPPPASAPVGRLHRKRAELSSAYPRAAMLPFWVKSSWRQAQVRESAIGLPKRPRLSVGSTNGEAFKVTLPRKRGSAQRTLTAGTRRTRRAHLKLHFCHFGCHPLVRSHTVASLPPDGNLARPQRVPFPHHQC